MPRWWNSQNGCQPAPRNTANIIRPRAARDTVYRRSHRTYRQHSLLAVIVSHQNFQTPCIKNIGSYLDPLHRSSFTLSPCDRPYHNPYGRFRRTISACSSSPSHIHLIPSIWIPGVRGVILANQFLNDHGGSIMAVLNISELYPLNSSSSH